MQHHINWLKRIVPPERLHFLDIKDGWEPLCKILDVPVPDEPFPRINEKAAMKELDGVMMARVYTHWGIIIGGALAAVVGLMMARRLSSRYDDMFHVARAVEDFVAFMYCTVLQVGNRVRLWNVEECLYSGFHYIYPLYF